MPCVRRLRRAASALAAAIQHSGGRDFRAAQLAAGDGKGQDALREAEASCVST